jgi:hypothetical protein
MNMKRIWIYGIVLFSIIFIAAAVIFGIFEVDILPSQFYGALIGVVITAIITVFLLQGQTANEEKRDISIRVFEKKQEIYHAFLEELKRIIQDGEITIVAKGEGGALDKNVDELKDLIFQLGFLQMHTDEKIMDTVLQRVANIIRLLTEFGAARQEDKQKELPGYYASLSEELFQMIALLRSDLYNTESKPIRKDRMEAILKQCGGLYVQTSDFDEYEALKYFWDELRRQLRSRGYPVPDVNEDNKLNAFLTLQKNTDGIRFQFEIYRADQLEYPIDFNVQLLHWGYYYGFTANNFGKIDDMAAYPTIVRNIKTLSPLFGHNGVWFGYKLSERYELNFQSKSSPSFDFLKDPRKRERLVVEIADEMESYVKGFLKIMNETKEN